MSITNLLQLISMGTIATLARKIPFIRNYVGPGGRLTDGSHRFAMEMLTGNPDASFETARLKPASPATINRLWATAASSPFVIDGISSTLIAKLSERYAVQGKIFTTELSLPAGVTLSKNARVFINSPILGEVDLAKSGFATVEVAASGKTMSIKSKGPVPSSINTPNGTVTTSGRFILTVMDHKKTIAKTDLDIGAENHSNEELVLTA